LSKLVIQNANIIDGTGGPVLEEASVVVEGEKIVEVGRGLDAPRDAQVVDAQGAYLLPGLIDSHVHVCSNSDPSIMANLNYRRGTLLLFGVRNLRRMLEAGFTTVRDMGAPEDYGLALRDGVRSGLVRGPRLLACGKVISMTGGHADFHLPSGVSFSGMSRIADGVEECRKAAREQLRMGGDFVKICSSGGVMSPTDPVDTPQFTLEEIEAITYEAGCVGRYVASHAHGATGIKNAILAGVRTIEHGSLIDSEGRRLLRERGGFLVPTLVAGWKIVEHGLEAGIPKYAVDKAEEIAHEVRKNTLKSLREGVKVAMGTDAGTPFNKHGENAEELALMVEAGFTPMEALVAATKVGADCVGLGDKLGTVEPGKLADLVLVDGNPLKDIRILADKSHIRMVVKGGVVEVDRGA